MWPPSMGMKVRISSFLQLVEDGPACGKRDSCPENGSVGSAGVVPKKNFLFFFHPWHHGAITNAFLLSAAREAALPLAESVLQLEFDRTQKYLAVLTRSSLSIFSGKADLVLLAQHCRDVPDGQHWFRPCVLRLQGPMATEGGAPGRVNELALRQTWCSPGQRWPAAWMTLMARARKPPERTPLRPVAPVWIGSACALQTVQHATTRCRGQPC